MPNAIVETITMATQFVNLALRYARWDQINDRLPADEMDTLFKTVAAAGFNPKSIMPGKLVGPHPAQDGSNTGNTYPINVLCPFKVVSQEDGDHYFATGWLDCALRRAVFGATNQK